MLKYTGAVKFTTAKRFKIHYSRTVLKFNAVQRSRFVIEICVFVVKCLSQSAQRSAVNRMQCICSKACGSTILSGSKACGSTQYLV